jgi:glycosyltransferase involved in cell wall biosynthesis
MSTKVLFDHQIFTWEKFGGISRYFSEIIPRLSQYEILPFTSVLFSNNEYIQHIDSIKNKKFLPNLNFKGKALINKNLNATFTYKNLSKKKFDVFHPTFYHPYFLKHLKGKPFVLTVHDLIHEIYRTEFNKVDKTLQFKESLIPKAEKIITVSNNTKNDLLRYYNIPENKVLVIYHGASDNKPILNTTIKNLLLPSKYILYVGKRNELYKNFKTLINSFQKLIEKDKSIFLVCVGPKFDKNEIELFSKLKISNNIKQFSVSDELLNTIYQNALLFVYPSKYEGFGLPILESYKNQCPVLLSNNSCFREVAADAAVFFDPNDENDLYNKLSNIIYYSNNRQILIDKGKLRLKFYNWDKSAELSSIVYKSIFNGH